MDYSKFAGQKVFITGGSGFIGSHLIRKLKEVGAIIIATEHQTQVYGADYVVECDVRDIYTLVQAFVEHSPTFVFHLAAEAIVGNSQVNPITTFHTNVMGVVNVLAACRGMVKDYGHVFRGIVIASTDKVYGRCKDLPYHEGTKISGYRQFYEASKVGGDFAARSFTFDDIRLPIGIARFGNVYGPGDTHIDSRLIPQTIFSFIRGEVLSIRSDGQTKRDYLYIDDVIDGYLRLALYSQTGLYSVFNFGAMRPIRTLDAVAAIREHFPNSKNPEILNTNLAKQEIPVQYLDASLAQSELGWFPLVSFSDGIAKTIAWYKDAYA